MSESKLEVDSHASVATSGMSTITTTIIAQVQLRMYVKPIECGVHNNYLAIHRVSL